MLDYFHPHIRMRASEYARTKKVYKLFKSQIKERFGRDLKTDSEVYRHYLLLMLEHWLDTGMTMKSADILDDEPCLFAGTGFSESDGSEEGGGK